MLQMCTVKRDANVLRFQLKCTLNGPISSGGRIQEVHLCSNYMHITCLTATSLKSQAGYGGNRESNPICMQTKHQQASQVLRYFSLHIIPQSHMLGHVTLQNILDTKARIPYAGTASVTARSLR